MSFQRPWMWHPRRMRGAGEGGKPESPVTRMLWERRRTKGHTPGPVAQVDELAEVSGNALELNEGGIYSRTAGAWCRVGQFSRTSASREMPPSGRGAVVRIET